MKNWEKLTPDVTKILSKHYTKGRDGSSIEAITIHHMAGNLSIQQCYNTWNSKETSAHYAVQADGKIGQMVYCKNTAWACGNWDANCKTISIEHANNSSNPWTVGDKTLEEGAHLTAALCKYYKLGRPKWGSNVFPHSHWSSTACPGELYGTQKSTFIKRAQYWYDTMTKNSWIKQDGKWWYRHADGTYTKNNWEKINSKWYYFDKSGWMLESTWKKWKNKWYYLKADGSMARSEWVKYKDKWYYLMDDGHMIANGWVGWKGKLYRVDSKGAMLSDCEFTSEGKVWTADKKGVCTEVTANA